MSATDDILNYWFGESDDALTVLQHYGKLWFDKDEQVDLEIKERFGQLVTDAGTEGLLIGDEPLAQRYLATIILIDQFTRNIYRGQKRSFASDQIALDLALEALDNGFDQHLQPIQRLFLYLPLEHAEDLSLQNRSVELFEQLKNGVSENWQAAFDGFLDYAVRHQVIIERFGRFPHRNQMLGRASTPEEIEFLQQPNSSF